MNTLRRRAWIIALIDLAKVGAVGLVLGAIVMGFRALLFAIHDRFHVSWDNLGCYASMVFGAVIIAITVAIAVYPHYTKSVLQRAERSVLAEEQGAESDGLLRPSGGEKPAHPPVERVAPNSGSLWGK